MSLMQGVSFSSVPTADDLGRVKGVHTQVWIFKNRSSVNFIIVLESYFQCRHEMFCLEFLIYPLKFHSKHCVNVYFISVKYKSSFVEELVSIFKWVTARLSFLTLICFTVQTWAFYSLYLNSFLRIFFLQFFMKSPGSGMTLWLQFLITVAATTAATGRTLPSYVAIIYRAWNFL